MSKCPYSLQLDYMREGDGSWPNKSCRMGIGIGGRRDKPGRHDVHVH
jgi:hypothetical protein